MDIQPLSQPNAFSEPDSCRTLILEVDGYKFWVPRDALANYSPVFKAMLYGQFDEANRESVPLPDKNADDIHELLLCIVPTPCVKDIDDSNLEVMLVLADEYQIEDLRRRAENFLKAKFMASGKSQEKLFCILRVGSKWRMRSLLQECIKKCAQEFTVQQLQPLFEDLRSEVIASLMLYASMSSPDGKCQYVCGGGHGGSRCQTHKRLGNMVCVYCGIYRCGACLNDGPERGTCTMTLGQVDETVKSLLDRMTI